MIRPKKLLLEFRNHASSSLHFLTDSKLLMHLMTSKYSQQVSKPTTVIF
jgi:hypothetical protein